MCLVLNRTIYFSKFMLCCDWNLCSSTFQVLDGFEILYFKVIMKTLIIAS